MADTPPEKSMIPIKNFPHPAGPLASLPGSVCWGFNPPSVERAGGNSCHPTRMSGRALKCPVPCAGSVYRHLGRVGVFHCPDPALPCPWPVVCMTFQSLMEGKVKAGKSRKAHGFKTSQLRKLLKLKRKTSVFPMKKGGGRFWIRTREGVSQQIYSLPPLATWVTYHSRNNQCWPRNWAAGVDLSHHILLAAACQACRMMMCAVREEKKSPIASRRRANGGQFHRTRTAVVANCDVEFCHDFWGTAS